MSKFYIPTAKESAAIDAAIADDPDAAPDMAAAMDAGLIVKRGPGRPRLVNPKRVVNLRIDADIIDHFKSDGPGWQTRINAALRRAVRRKGPRAA